MLGTIIGIEENIVLIRVNIELDKYQSLLNLHVIMEDRQNKIVGEIEPVGETNTDNARFSNLQTLLNTLDILIDEVTFVLPCENRYEYSMQRAGQEVRHWIEDKRQQFAYNLREGEQDE